MEDNVKKEDAWASTTRTWVSDKLEIIMIALSLSFALLTICIIWRPDFVKDIIPFVTFFGGAAIRGKNGK